MGPLTRMRPLPPSSSSNSLISVASLGRCFHHALGSLGVESLDQLVQALLLDLGSELVMVAVHIGDAFDEYIESLPAAGLVAHHVIHFHRRAALAQDLGADL